VTGPRRVAIVAKLWSEVSRAERAAVDAMPAPCANCGAKVCVAASSRERIVYHAQRGEQVEVTCWSCMWPRIDAETEIGAAPTAREEFRRTWGVLEPDDG
jgi:hypothetical protein